MPNLGDTFRIQATITDITGALILVPDSQLVSLYHPDDTLHASTAAPTSDGGGVFHVDFSIPSSDPVGVWLVVWSATKDGITKVAKMDIYVADPP